MLRAMVRADAPLRLLLFRFHQSSEFSSSLHLTIIRASNRSQDSTEKRSRMNDAKAENACEKEIILEKIRSRNYAGARTLVLEVLKGSRLEHATEMLTICDILCSAEIELPKFGVDWYWVLQVDPLAEPSVVKAQYQKLVSLLEPVKDDLPGAKLALKYVQDAFSVLWDPGKRIVFDSERYELGNALSNSNSEVLCGTHKGLGNEAATGGGTARGSSWNPCRSSGNKRPAHGLCGGSGDVHLTENYTNEKQKKPSWFKDEAKLKDGAGLSSKLKDDHRSCSTPLVTKKRPDPDFYSSEKNRKAELLFPGQVWVAYDRENMPRRYALIDSIIPNKFEIFVKWLIPCPQSMQEKRWCSAGLPVVCGSFVPDGSKITLVRRTMFSHLLSHGTTEQHYEIYPKKGDVWTIYKDWNMEWCAKPKIRENCGFELVEILTDYLKDAGIKVAYLMEVDGYKNVFKRCLKQGHELSFQVLANQLFMFSHNVPAFRFTGGEIEGIANGMFELDASAVPDNLVQDFSRSIVASVDSASQLSKEVNCFDKAGFDQFSRPSVNTTDSGSLKTGTQNCKPKLSPNDFAAEQVWAIYDGRDAMPRSYVKVINVVSPTIVQVVFLEPHPMLDEEIHWVEETLPIACGVFRAGRETTNLEMSRFSHLVKCDKSRKNSFYKIFPHQGEIWAMYKNWNSNWRNSDFVGCQYWVVEIISDFSEDMGIKIGSLIEVKGYSTSFQRQLFDGFQLMRQLSRLEMLSFSHRIPAFVVTGIKDNVIPKGSWHLEPDALPLKSIN